MMTVKTLYLLMGFLLFNIGGNAQNKSEFYLEKANKDYELHNYNQAIESYLLVLKDYPRDPELLGRLADCYRHLNSMFEAEKYYELATRDPRVAPIHIFNYAKVLKVLQRYSAAKNYFLKYSKVKREIGNHYARSCDFAIDDIRMASSSYSVSPETELNTPYSDFGISFYGNQVIFSSARTDIMQSRLDWTGAAKDQLFVSNIRSGGSLDKPTIYKNSYRVSEEGLIYNLSNVSFSPDGKFVVYTKNNFTNGTRQIPSSGMSLNLWVAEVAPNGEWVNRQEFLYNAKPDYGYYDSSYVYNTGFPNFSPDGKKLYFSSDMPGGFGGYDIYEVSFFGKRNGKFQWGDLEPLGPIVNSAGHEITPHFDGANLFFSSDYHHGFGGYDIFRAEQTDGRQWTRIFHLGNEINSSFDDYGFVYNSFQNLGYFTSNRQGGRGKEDIYRVTKSSDLVTLQVQNAANGEPISGAIIDFTNCGSPDAYRTDARGRYTFQAVQNFNCDIIVRKDGFNEKVQKLTIIGLQEGQVVPINLNKIGEEYYGRILDYTNNTPVPGVKVIVTSQTLPSAIETQTDVNGVYALALQPNSVYIIRYSRAGYKEVLKTVHSEDGKNRELLGTIRLVPVSALTGSNYSGGTIDPYGNRDSPGEYEDGATQSGYAVQVAALREPDLDPFRGLEELGNLYYVEVGRYYKVRLGVFETRKKAEQVKASAQRRGYPKAFIVQQKGTASTMTKKSPGNYDNSNSSSFTSRIPSGSFQSDYPYLIQLGAYRDQSSFDGSKIGRFGDIVGRRKDGLYFKYLSGFSTLSKANSTLKSIQKRGFPSAFVVKNNNGDLERVR